MSVNYNSIALQSLTATYTDSEGEEDELNRSRRRSASNVSQINDDADRDNNHLITSTTPDSNKSGTNTPQSGSSISAAEIRRVAARLVSYDNNDEAISEDEEEEDSNSRVEFPTVRVSRPPSPESSVVRMLPGEELLPAEPTGYCPAEKQEKIARLYEKIQGEGIDMNSFIQQRKQFRNPSIYEKLIIHLEIEELGTNYPKSIYNPKQWSEGSYYEALAKKQRDEMDRREKERRDRTKVEFVSGTAIKKTTSEDDKKRKSKWDQTAPNQQQSAAILTSVPTGTKTAIPAFGTLPKKAKIA